MKLTFRHFASTLRNTYTAYWELFGHIGFRILERGTLRAFTAHTKHAIEEHATPDSKRSEI